MDKQAVPGGIKAGQPDWAGIRVQVQHGELPGYHGRDQPAVFTGIQRVPG